MATDVGAWKLLIYPIAFILIVGAILNLAVSPFVDNGNTLPSNPSFSLSITKTMLVPLANVLPSAMGSLITEQIDIFAILPTMMQNIIFILCTVAFGYVIVIIIQGFIP